MVRFPVKIFVIIVICICFGIVITTVYGFKTLLKLRDTYMINLGHETLRSIFIQNKEHKKNIRRQGDFRRRDRPPLIDPEFWQSRLTDLFPEYKESIVFFALLDEAGNLLASAGDLGTNLHQIQMGVVTHNKMSIFVFETEFRPPRGPPHKRKWMPKVEGWKFRMGIYTSQADFIMKLAYTYVFLSVFVIILILVLTSLFLRTLYRFVDLQERERSQRHLISLGRMGATLAHEIRNPLGAMKGLTQIAQEKLPWNHDIQPSLTTVVSEAERLENLVNNLLSYAKPKTLKIEKIDLKSLFNEIDNLIQHRIEEAKVFIDFNHKDSKVPIFSDKNALRQIILNVIVNAIEATPKGKSIQIYTMINDKKELTIDVIDEGEGIKNKNSEELFEPFMTTKLKGTGLGLSISKKLIDRLSGTIHLTNNREVGAKCTIKIPAIQ